MAVDDDDVRSFAQAFAAMAEAAHALAQHERSDTIRRAIVDHLGTDPTDLPVVSQAFPVADHPNVQLALEGLLAQSPSGRLLGLPAEAPNYGGFGLAGVVNPGRHSPTFDPVAPGYVNVPVDVDRTLPCVLIGLWLLQHAGEPVVTLSWTGERRHGNDDGVRVEVLSATPARGVAFLEALTAAVAANNVYRGKVLSFTFDRWGSFGLEFHRLPDLQRDDLILPEDDLAAIERHTLGVSRNAPRLLASARHLKRGLLLYGPPGTGKTFSVMYLCGQMPERTTILLSGQAAVTLGQAAAIARALQPSMLVLEDVDLVAAERTMPGMGSNPLLFQLLNEMDGLDEDADVIFVLTTNRVELLEPALAARPGRIDQAVEIRLPDAACRRRLLDLYLRGIEVRDVDHDAVVDRTAGVSAAFLKELARRAALIAAEADADRREPSDQPGRLVVDGMILDAALDDLLEHSAPVLRRMLGAADGDA